MIVATAGHIDHGKTALVKALTGIDADRLPEEKARGITLDLGFAYAPGGGPGFVDVPGHEGLVRTMVAGASGVAAALLVVAADDGIMPQTREHLAILDLLGLTRGVVALTKSDRVASGRLETLAHEVRALLAVTGLRGAPVLACSSLTGAGLPEIAAALARVAAPAPPDEAERGFRLAIDRGFTLEGAGLVVTGAVHAGRVRVGDPLVLSPGGREVRVRAIHRRNAPAQAAEAGERCALNLAGPRLSREDVHRGVWVLAPGLHAPTTRLDVHLRLLPGEAGLRHRAAVHLHLGAASVTGRVLLPDSGALAPGGDGAAQLVLDAPIGALARDRFVLRDASARRTIGGGQVVDPLAPRRGARSPARRAGVAALAAGDDAGVLAALLATAEGGIDLDHLRLIRNLAPAAEAALLDAADVAVVPGPAGRLGFSRARLDGLRTRLISVLDALHRDEPDDPGLSADELALRLASPLRAAVRPVLERALAEGAVARSRALFHRPGHIVRLRPADAELWEAIRARLAAAGLDQPRLALLADALRMEPEDIRGLLDKLGRLGWLRRISQGYYVLPEVLAELARVARAVAAEHPEGLLTVGRFREAAGIGRHFVMPLLEHFDAAGLTTRLDEGRRIRADRRDGLEDG